MSEQGARKSEEDVSDEQTFYNDFEACAQSVALLYRDCSWKSLQIAAASSTQLYKSGIEAKKRAWERGFHSGRQNLAKELLAACRMANRFDGQILINLLSKTALLPPEALSDLTFNHNHRSPNHKTYQNHEPSGILLFQQALNHPNVTHSSSNSTVNRSSPDLNSFLTSQVHRHRKRQHSPSVHSPVYTKRNRKS
uniref:HUWE1-associated protein modifying stress responses n=1 Tax=Steinernema glaseri TaxID=37863 RepID=A0A1I8A5V9_9BILA